MKRITQFIFLCLISSSALSAEVTDYLGSRIGTQTGDSRGVPYAFADSLPQIPGAKIKSITVSSDSQFIHGIRFDYTYDNSATAGNISSGSRSETVDLAPDEYIKSATGFKALLPDETGNTAITRLRFTTTKFRTLWFAKDNMNDKPLRLNSGGFNTTMGDGRFLVGIYGTHNKYITSIGFEASYPLKLSHVETIIHREDISEWEEDKVFFANALGLNESEILQKTQSRISYSEGNSISNTWTNTYNTSLTLGYKISAGIKIMKVVELAQEISATYTKGWTFAVGENETYTDAADMWAVFDVNIPPRSIMLAYQVITYGKGRIPYTVVFENTNDGERFYAYGELDYANIVTTRSEWKVIGHYDEALNAIANPRHQALFDEHVTNSNPF